MEMDKSQTMVPYSHPLGGVVAYSHPLGGVVAYSHPPGAPAITCICAKLELSSAGGLAVQRSHKGWVGVVRTKSPICT